VRVGVTDGPLEETGAELLCLGLFEDEDVPEPFAAAPGSADVRSGYKKLAILRPERPERVLVVGLGAKDEFEPERARVAAALAARKAATYEAHEIAWSLPAANGDGAAVAAALVEGTILASYRFDRFKTTEDEDEGPPPALESLALFGADKEASAAAEAARVTAEAVNRARDLQNLPANVVTPTYLAERATELAVAHERVEVEVLGRGQIDDLGMGGLAGVSKGTEEEPRLIVLRYAGGGGGEVIGLVGKAVTFDSGGISIKPASRMHEMKMDRSGGAAVIESVAAIAELELDVELLAVVPATENMPSGTALKPGDIITQSNGKTVEIINTDAEGRLILADALAYCVEQGADRIVDLATLTGAVLTALGSTYAALISNDDAWAAEVEAASSDSGELAWRLPLHPEYKELTKGTVTDLVNASESRKAGTIYAASFLEEFVDGKPWAHLDIAGTAWDMGREYVGKGATGFGVRLLVALARDRSG
jgi:leucyl aminopeptidase